MLQIHAARAGTLTQEGQIACECKQCRPGGVIKTQSISCSEFEEHAGSRERRPAESIYLQCITVSLKVRPSCPAAHTGAALHQHPSSLMASEGPARLSDLTNYSCRLSSS